MVVSGLMHLARNVFQLVAVLESYEGWEVRVRVGVLVLMSQFHHLHLLVDLVHLLFDMRDECFLISDSVGLPISCDCDAISYFWLFLLSDLKGENWV